MPRVMHRDCAIVAHFVYLYYSNFRCLFVSSRLLRQALDCIVSRPIIVVAPAANGASQCQLCLACHGPDSRGNQQLGVPPLTISNDWYLIRQLQNPKQRVRGADAPRDGTGATMQPIASTLSEQGMQDVVIYIQTLR
jgi:cytochrome c553